MGTGVAIVLIVIGVIGVAFLLYVLARFLLAVKRGQLPMSAYNTFTGRWTDDPRGRPSEQRDADD